MHWQTRRSIRRATSLVALLGALSLIVWIGVSENMTPLSAKRYTLRYQGQTLRCLVELAKTDETKSAKWTGGVNLEQCDNGKEYMGATDVTVLRRPNGG